MEPVTTNSIYLIDLDQVPVFETENAPKNRTRTTDEQLDKIISFMANHSDFPKGSKKLDEETTFAWEKLTEELNVMGPPHHSSKEWRTVWSRYKGNKKRKSDGSSASLVDAGFGEDETTDFNRNQSLKSASSSVSECLESPIMCQNCLNGPLKIGETVGETIPLEERSNSVVIELLKKIVDNTSNILVALTDLKEAFTANSLSKN